MELIAKRSIILNTITVGPVSNIPTIQFFTLMSRNNTLSKSFICYHWLSVSGISMIMHCRILTNMPYCKFFYLHDIGAPAMIAIPWNMTSWLKHVVSLSNPISSTTITDLNVLNAAVSKTSDWFQKWLVSEWSAWKYREDIWQTKHWQKDIVSANNFEWS